MNDGSVQQFDFLIQMKIAGFDDGVYDWIWVAMLNSIQITPPPPSSNRRNHIRRLHVHFFFFFK